VDANEFRGQWVDPRDAQMPLVAWAEEFLSLSRRLSKTTQQTYRRDLDKYVLPRFGGYRLGQLPADQIENWLNDEIAAGIAPSSVHRHYRTLRRVMQVAVQKQKILSNPCDRVDPPHVPRREMTSRPSAGARAEKFPPPNSSAARLSRRTGRARHGTGRACGRQFSRGLPVAGGGCEGCRAIILGAIIPSSLAALPAAARGAVRTQHESARNARCQRSRI